MRIVSVMGWKCAVIGCLALFAISTAAEPHKQHNYVGVHGMVLLSSEKGNLVVSHLPLYVKPHDYQAVFTAQLEDARALNTARTGLVTLVPEPFDLLAWLSGDITHAKVKVFKGHFERGGTFWYETSVRFVERVYKKRISSTEGTQNGTFDVIVFENGESLRVHRIARAPSFDAMAWSSDADTATMQCAISHSEEALTPALTLCLDTAPAYLETADFSD